MHWVVQNNMFEEVGHKKFIKVLDEENVAYDLVEMIPLSHAVLPEPKPTSDHIFVYGSTMLSEEAVNRGWKPGSFLNEHHNFLDWR